MANYYLISGYWKDDNTMFEDYLVCDGADINMQYEEDVFFYGLTEKDIKAAIANHANTELEFVILDYKIA
jgi:hypothetical protein